MITKYDRHMQVVAGRDEDTKDYIIATKTAMPTMKKALITSKNV